jgi:hypothetical protein
MPSDLGQRAAGKVIAGFHDASPRLRPRNASDPRERRVLSSPSKPLPVLRTRTASHALWWQDEARLGEQGTLTRICQFDSLQQSASARVASSANLGGRFMPKARCSGPLASVGRLSW